MRVAFSPDGRLALTGSPGYMAQLWDAVTAQPVGQPMPGTVYYEAPFSPDGKVILTGGLASANDNRVRLWDAATGKPVAQPLAHRAHVSSMAFRPDGQVIVTGSADFTARLWDAATGRPLSAPLAHPGWVRHVAFSPDGQTILTGAPGRTPGRGLGAAHGAPLAAVRGTPRPAAGSPPCHQGEISPRERALVSYSPHGRTVLITGLGAPARLWNVATAEPIGPPLAHRGVISSAAFSPDGQTVLTGSWDKTARLWDTHTGKPAGPPLVHRRQVEGVAFNPDGQSVLTVSDDNAARLWNARTGKPIGLPLQHQGMIPTARISFSNNTLFLTHTAVAFSPDGRTVLTGSADAATGMPVGPPFRHEQAIFRVTFSSDGRSLVVRDAGDASTRLWRLPVDLPNDVARLAAWVQTVTGSELDDEGSLRVLTGAGWHKRRDRLSLLGGSPWPPVEPPGPALVEEEAQRLVNELVGRLGLKSDVLEALRQGAVASEPVRKRALSLAERVSEVPAQLNIFSWSVVRRPDAGAVAYRRALRQAETACRLARQSGLFLTTLGVARYRTGQYREALAELERAAPLYGSPHPARFAVIAMAQHRLGQTADARKSLEQLRGVMSQIRWSTDAHSNAFLDEACALIDPSPGSGPAIDQVGELDDPSTRPPYLRAEIAVFSPDGRYVLAGSEDKTMRLWDRESGRLIRRFDDHGGQVTSVAFAPDGRRALSGGEDKVVRLRDLYSISDEPLRALKGHTGWVFQVAFSRDGRLAYSTSGGPNLMMDGTDSAVRVWDLEAGREVRKLTGHKGRVFGLAVSPDGRRVLTGGDTTLILWDASTGQEIRCLRGHKGLISNVAFLPDGHRAVSGSLDQTIRLWDLETGQELHQFLGHPTGVTWVAVAPDGRRLLSSDFSRLHSAGHNGHELRLWDLEGRKLIRRIDWGAGVGEGPTRGSFSPDGQNAAWGGTHNKVRLYRLSVLDGAGPTPVPPHRTSDGNHANR